MKKHYSYTDPLAAAWMAKHFGMKLTIRDGVYSPPWPELAASGNADGYFIHPDSLHLLEPMEGDLVKARHTAFVCGILLDNEKAKFSSGTHVVLQRDGKPFHWPECDN